MQSGVVTTFDALFEGFVDGYEISAARLGGRTRRFRLADRIIEVSFASDSLLDAFGPAMTHLTCGPGPEGEVDFRIQVWESAPTGVSPPHPDWSALPIGRRGVLSELERPGGHVNYVWGVGAAQVYCEQRRHAVYWAEDAEAIPYWERSFPFRQLLSWFFGDVAVQPVHAACVAWEDRGVLLPGISGSGKSTTTMQLGLAGYDLLGDDYVLLDVRAAPKVWSLYRSIKLDDGSVARFPSIAAEARRRTPADEKSVVLWPTSMGGRMRREIELTAVILPKVIPGAMTDLVSASSADVVLSLAPTTINHLDVDAAKVLQMSRKAAELPRYRLIIGREPERIPEIIKDVLER